MPAMSKSFEYGLTPLGQTLSSGGLWDAAEDVQLRPGAEAGAVEDREPDRHCDPLFDPHKRDREHRGHGERELERIKLRDRAQVAAMEEPRCDEPGSCFWGRSLSLLCLGSLFRGMG